MFDTARIVGVFRDDDHPETYAVGIVNEDGNDLLFSEDDPVVIAEMATRLVMFADEIFENQKRNINKTLAQLHAMGPSATMRDLAEHNKRLHEAGVVSLDSKRGE